MNISSLTVGQMSVNCYLVTDPLSSQTLIVDPGDDAQLIIDTITGHELKPLAIIATHGHFDHILAVNELKLAYNLPFYIHQDDLFLVKKMRPNTQHFLGFDPGPPPIPDKYLSAGSLKIENCELKIIETPGHTPGSICLYSKSDNFLIAGDLIFAQGGVGRTDFSYSNHQDLLTSINQILKLPPNTTIYSGHGPSTTIREELVYHQS